MICMIIDYKRKALIDTVYTCVQVGKNALFYLSTHHHCFVFAVLHFELVGVVPKTLNVHCMSSVIKLKK